MNNLDVDSLVFSALGAAGIFLILYSMARILVYFGVL